jgi:hypothetical protein
MLEILTSDTIMVLCVCCNYNNSKTFGHIKHWIEEEVLPISYGYAR